MSMTPVQEQALTRLQEITNGDPRKERQILESVGWNVERAIQVIYDGNAMDVDPTPSPSSSASRAPIAPPRRFESMESEDLPLSNTPRTPRNPVPMYPRITKVLYYISYPLTISFSLVANIVQFVFRLLRIPLPRFNTSSLRFTFPGGFGSRPRQPPRPGNPVDQTERWVRELEDDTGAMRITRATAAATGVENGNGSEGLRKREKGEGRGNLLPDFWIGSYEGALKAARDEIKILCVILVSEEHDDTAEFKLNVLTDRDLVRALTDNEFIVWGGDVRDSEAYQTAQKLSSTTYPFVAFVSLKPRTSGSSGSASSQLSVISRHEGSPSNETSATTLHSHITNTLLPRVTPLLTRARKEARLRQQERDLRAEQDKAFEQAMKRDRERMAKIREEERKKREEEAEKKRQEEEKRMRAVWRDDWRRWKKQQLAEEPASTVKGLIRVGIRLPNGQRLVRRFNPSDPVESLYAFADVHFLPSKDDRPAPSTPPADYTHEYEFGLATTYPRKEVPFSSTATLGDVDVLSGGANLVVELKAGATVEETSDSE